MVFSLVVRKDRLIVNILNLKVVYVKNIYKVGKVKI